MKISEKQTVRPGPGDQGQGRTGLLDVTEEDPIDTVTVIVPPPAPSGGVDVITALEESWTNTEASVWPFEYAMVIRQQPLAGMSSTPIVTGLHSRGGFGAMVMAGLIDAANNAANTIQTPRALNLVVFESRNVTDGFATLT